MAGTTGKKVIGADIRARLDHPVIDSDAHVVEAQFVVDDFLKQVAGPKMVERFHAMRRPKDRPEWAHKSSFWVPPAGPYSIDRATVMLPKLYKERLDETGIDFAIVYTTMGLGVLHIADEELRRASYRALNMMYADMFSDVSDRLTPSALIPTATPEEAIDELEFVVKELGLKTVTINSQIHQTYPGVKEEAPQFTRIARWVRSPAMDAPYDYDPFWAKCVELGVAPVSHNSDQGIGNMRMSPTNYTFNHLGTFAAGGEYFCKALFLGGVTRRFPTLKFAFLEGGVHWGTALYNGLCEFWEKRNIKTLLRTQDPRTLDVPLMVEKFREYGEKYLTAERIEKDPYHPWSSHIDHRPEPLDEFEACGIRREQDIRDLFVPHFYFGCEADDRLNAVAFDTRINHFGARLKAMLGSDIGHWDAPDITQVMVNAHELVDMGLMTDDDFRDFTFGNVAELHASMNPDFFKGTAVEDAVAAHMKETAAA